MSDREERVPVADDEGGQTAAVKAPPGTRPRPDTAPPRVDRLPPWNVLLHNDEVNDMGYVVEAIIALTPLKPECAIERMFEAHRTGVALLLSTHKEHAELLQEQFASKRLKITIEAGR
jgi:ATP-dependent Clp protease adaptor protein ClpS